MHHRVHKHKDFVCQATLQHRIDVVVISRAPHEYRLHSVVNVLTPVSVLTVHCLCNS